jgi:hypothetical protein
MWEPRCLTTLWASMACYRDSLSSSPHGARNLRTADSSAATVKELRCFSTVTPDRYQDNISIWPRHLPNPFQFTSHANVDALVSTYLQRSKTSVIYRVLSAWVERSGIEKLEIAMATNYFTINTLYEDKSCSRSRTNEWSLYQCIISILWISITLSPFKCVTLDGDWTTYTHHSELQVITALSLVSTVHKLLHAESSPACNIFKSHFLVTDVNSRDSSASRTLVVPSRFQYRTDYQLSTELVCPSSLLFTSSARTA